MAANLVQKIEKRRNIWKPELYRIQLEAPSPKPLFCDKPVETPVFYDKYYHGVLSHKEAAALLEDKPEGCFLVRKGSATNDFCTLSLRFNNKIHHYKIYHEKQGHYLSDKFYSTMDTLVADGLVTMHMELKAGHLLEMMHSHVAYTESPYVTLNRKKMRELTVAKSDKKEILCQEGIINDSFINEEAEGENKSNCNSTTKSIIKYSKPHFFKLHNFKGLNWCEMCANFLWGFTAQGVKCEDCGFIAHQKCSERVPSHCLPDLKKLRGVFGIDLTTLLNAHSSTLPFVVRICINEIEKRGMDVEGIYRISGFADEIDALKAAFDKDGESADVSQFNINVVAGTLKLYLRLLPVPLITYELHSQFLQTCNIESDMDRTQALRKCLDELPPAHYNCLQYVIQHLHRVTQQADKNKMSAHNISTVFAPTLVATPPVVTDLTFEIRALQCLIHNSPFIFYGDR